MATAAMKQQEACPWCGQRISHKQFIELETRIRSEEKRREAWDRAFSGRAGWTGKEPNAGHYAVARLVEAGKVSAVITQNVDNLHQDSGVLRSPRAPGALVCRAVRRGQVARAVDQGDGVVGICAIERR